MIHLDVDLFTLAYMYLQHKARKTHKQYTIGDLFIVCEKILQWSESRNSHKRANSLQFTDGTIKLDEKILK